MKNDPIMFQTFEHKGYKLVRLPKEPQEHQHDACRRCIRNILYPAKAFRCMDLPNCADSYFKLADSLTPEENAQVIVHKLEGHT